MTAYVPSFVKEDYELSFWAQGVSIFVTDIHAQIYRDLEVLYLIDRGAFKQYFTKAAYARALDRGLAFYGNKVAFDEYKKRLDEHIVRFRVFFDQEMRNKEALSLEVVGAFFEYTRVLCGEYTKINLEFTDKAFASQAENPTIRHNLAKAALFKDAVRMFMNTVLFEPEGYAAEAFRILGAQFAAAPSLIEGLTQQEILALFAGSRLDSARIAARQGAFVESFDQKPLEGEEAHAVLLEFREASTTLGVLTGQVANKGRHAGTVKVIPVDYAHPGLMKSHIELMGQGDVLVAETTAPELLLACQKAGAIVTDVGGLLSHAAIVSRELGIPCIVGTKTATRLLKDGDRVEVDAYAGTVTVLNG